MVGRSPRNWISLPAKFTLSSARIFRDSPNNGGSRWSTRNTGGWFLKVRMSRIIIAITDGHRAVYNTRGRGDRVPTCTCYSICSKVYLATRPPTTMGFTCSSIPARVYMHLTPGDGWERQSEWERKREERERDGGQIEHEPVPHLLPRVSRIQLAVSTSGPANDLPNFTIPERFVRAESPRFWSKNRL